ncbi:hypothetical protein [Pedobacter frigoris]|uniref:hypothetical protein n=1 Tax=Pedobacter frigoris TaxID=2571272 RepID=UPI00292D3081|nr:hypothetical protein [Pedobacter frigoris]
MSAQFKRSRSVDLAAWVSWYLNLGFVERFYLEPTNKTLVNANDLWDGQTLPLTLKLVGRFSKDKELPKTYNTKTTPEKARIFWYDKIVGKATVGSLPVHRI